MELTHSTPPLPDLEAVVTAAPRELLPQLIGRLEAAKAAAWVRLAAQVTVAPNTADPEGNLSVEEAARRLGLSDRWIYKNAKRLPFVRRIGRRVLCSARGLAEWNTRQRG